MNQIPAQPSRLQVKNWRFLTVLVLLFATAVFVSVWHVSQLQSKLTKTTALKNARLFTVALAEFRTLYTSEVVETAKRHGLKVSHVYAGKEKAIPLPATLTMLLGEKIGAHASGAKVRLYSPYPFPGRRETGGLRDQFGEQAWAFLSQNPDKPFYRFTERDGRMSLRYASADVMRSDCVNCHNSYPGSPKTDWQMGDLRGMLEVNFPLDEIVAQTQGDLRGTFAIFAAIALLGVISIGFVVSKLRRTSAELQEQVVVQTAEIRSEISEHKRTAVELETKAAELERSNHELDQFAYVTSHDLKAPLRAIANLSQWIEEDIGEQLEGDTRKQMDLLRGRVHRMEDLINGILQYSRVGRVAVDIETVDTAKLLEEIIDGLHSPEGISIDIVGKMPVFEAARVRLSQVFGNLLSNTIKYHDRPDGRVEVSVKDAGEFYEFTVADDGPGIAPEYHDKVFQIFQTLQAKDSRESTGVGLTVVKKIVEEQGGIVSLESGVGQGATFRFTWPKQPAKSVTSNE